jgi:alpha-tubulin suppressor-like RCC1 family protein
MRAPHILAVFIGAAIIGCHSGDATSPREVRIPTALAIYAGDDQSAIAGSAVPIAPAVQVTDSGGLPVQFVTVHFRTALYSGRVTDSVQTTDANGIATVGSWTLGDALGPNRLWASVNGVPEVEFSATGTSGPAASLEITSGDGQTALVGSIIEGISFLLTDAGGRPVSTPTQATFEVLRGAGVIGSSDTMSAPDGTLRLPRWTLGGTGGVNEVRVTIAGVPPVTVSATAVGFALRDVVAGGEHSCGLSAEGRAYCWGANDAGQLGDGSTASSSKPVAVTGGHEFLALTAGDQYTCGLRLDHSIVCWGANESGQLGNGTTSSSSVPVEVASDVSFDVIAAGGTHSCGISSETDARVFCWGSNDSGELGNGSLTPSSSPIPVLSVGDVVHTTGGALAAGASATCALISNGYDFVHLATCWGRTHHADGSTTVTLTPTVLFSVLNLYSIAAGGEHFCGVEADLPGYTLGGAIYCWGTGALGAGSGSPSDVLVKAMERVGTDDRYGILALGAAHSCAAWRAHGAQCWGSNDAGQLGSGTTDDHPTPDVVIAEPPAPGGVALSRNAFSAIAAGSRHSCGVAYSGLPLVGPVLCWGSNDAGQLGDGTTITRGYPTAIAPPVEINP